MLKTIQQLFASTAEKPSANTGETVSIQPLSTQAEQADRELSEQELQEIAGAGARTRWGSMF